MRTSAAVTIPRSAYPHTLHRLDWLGVGLLVWLGAGAAGGGLTLLSRTDGSNMGFTLDLLDGSPFSDYFWPGLILFALFGVGSIVTAILWARRWALAPFAAFTIGCAQMIWIVVELAIIKEVSFLHPLMFGIGLLVALAAVPAGLPAVRRMRTA